MLEIGSGDGGNLPAFLECGAVVMAVEPDEQLVAFTLSKLQAYVHTGKLQVVAKDFEAAQREHELTEKFDLIFMKDVVEHLHQPESHFLHMKELLRPDGMIFLAFPAWQMPFGGHQQLCKGRWMSRLPWYHLLPASWYRTLLSWAGEPADVLMEIRETRLTIERFENMVKAAGFDICERLLWLVNPVYEAKFGWKPRRLWGWLSRLPWIRNFLTSCAYYMLRPAHPR